MGEVHFFLAMRLEVRYLVRSCTEVAGWRGGARNQCKEKIHGSRIEQFRTADHASSGT